MKGYSYYISLEGLNLNRLFSSFNKHGIKVFDCSRPNYKTCEFGIKFLDYFKAKKLNLFKNFKLKIKRTFNLGFFVNNLIKNMGLYIGVIVATLICLIVSKTTLKINVLGIENIPEAEIIKSLNNFNVKTWQINTKSNEEIEKYLKQNNENISLVSVVKKGTNLIVNIKEKIEKQSTDISPICAEYNMVINSIEVGQGVSHVSVGDVVKKGDILVSPKQVLTNGEITKLKPLAKIDATVWITGNVEFKTKDVKYVKTGKKLVWSSYEFGGVQLFSSTPQLKFENYEKSVYNDYVFKNMFLPIKLNRTIFYETKAETITKNFEDNKAELIKQSVKLAYSKLPKGLNVANENTIISESNGNYYVTTYLQVNFKIEG